MTCLNVQTTLPLNQGEMFLTTKKHSPTVVCSTAWLHFLDFYHYSFTHINDQNKWQSPCKDERKPTKGSLTAISTTDVFTEGCLLSAEQSHTWETPKSFRETSRKPTCKFVTAMSQAVGIHRFYFFRKKRRKMRYSIKDLHFSGWFYKGSDRIRSSIIEKDNGQHRYVLSWKDKSLLIRFVGKGCTIDRKTEYVRGAIFHTFGLFTPSLQEGVFLGCI